MTYPLSRCLRDFIIEHLKPARSDAARAQFAADRLIDFFGADRDVTALTRKDGRNYRAKRLRDGVSDSTIRRELGVLKSALNFAADEERITAVPVLKLPPESPPRERWFTEDEVVKLMEQPMDDATRLFIYIAAGTGARRGAILDLTVGRVDLKNGYIDFRNPSMPVTKKRRVKTKINEWLMPVLAKACEGKAPREFVVPRVYNISRKVKKLLRAIGIDEKGISAHAFRRTFVMWAMLNGATSAQVSAATGDRIETLERSYMKLLPEHTAGATRAIKNPKGEVNAE